MARYTKHHSNYVYRKTHQTTKNGTIFERDWGTLGERHVIETGKKRVYTDSGFVFTDNIRPGLKKRNSAGEWSEAYTSDNLSNTVNESVNIINLPDTCDIRDYAYWGSASELVRSSIENIVKWFPGRLWAANNYFTRISKDGKMTLALQNIITDGHHNYITTYVDEELIDKECENIGTQVPSEECIEFLCSDDKPISTDECCIQFTDTASETDTNNCIEFGSTDDCEYPSDNKTPRYTVEEGTCNPYTNIVNKDRCDIKDRTISIFELRNPFNINLYDKNVIFDKYDNKLRNFAISWNQYTVNGYDIESYASWIKPYNANDPDFTVIYDVSIICNGTTIHLYGLKLGKTTLWCTDTPNIEIKPKNTIIEDFFNNLEGFEKVLLTRNTKPLYTAALITPILNNRMVYDYVEQLYMWPSTGYCIDVDTMAFSSYINQLSGMARIMDEEWCDNLWNHMTHESIKNFDWSHQREYDDNSDLDLIDGNTRIEKVLHLVGSQFDDVKRWVDAISYKNKIEYSNSVARLNNAELSDTAELNGWVVYSTKDNNNENIYLSDTIINNLLKLPSRWADSSTKCSHQKWYPTLDCSMLSQNDVDNEFMTRLILNGKNIFRTKGTKASIEMVMSLFGIGDNDYEMYERHYEVTPKKRDEIYRYYRGVYHDDEEALDYTYTQMNETSLANFLIANDYVVPETSPRHIKFGNDTDGYEYYDLVDEMTFGEVIEYLNVNKGLALNYSDDPYSGIPLNDVYINNEYYVVPFFNQKLIYDGDVQFETGGGWSKFISSNDSIDHIMFEGPQYENYNYVETLPYIDIVSMVGELLNINQLKIGNKSIYYVVDTTDYTEFSTVIPPNLSHYFKLLNKANSQNFGSWKNIPMHIVNQDGELIPCDEYFGEDETGYELYCNTIPGCDGVTYSDYLEAKYHDNMKADNMGNNPHVGYSKYDLGTEYLEYCELPFKYAIDNNTFKYGELIEVANNIRFDINIVAGEKIVNTVGDTTPSYYIPSKLLTIRNNINSDLYREYFRNVILKYLTQVIPSTTILVLEDF